MVSFAQSIETNLGTQSLDSAQNIISSKLFKLTNHIDGYFGEVQDIEENNGSYIKFEYAAKSREYLAPAYEPDFDLRVRFRNLENALQFKLTSDKEDEDETLVYNEDSVESRNNNTTENSIFRASLGFLKEQKKFWSISADTGLRLSENPTLFAKGRGRRSFYFGKDYEFRAVNRVLIEDRSGLFNYTDLNLNKPLNRDFKFRYANKFVWEDSINELTTSHGPTVFHELDDKQRLSYNFRTRFQNKPDVYAITGHELYATYRRDIYKRWIFLNITPGYSFMKEHDYLKVAFINIKLQALFGDY